MNDSRTDSQRLKERLDACHDWPCAYTFKFIVPAAGEREIKNLLDEILKDAEFSVRPSSKGKWVSVTARAVLASSDEVLDVYESVSQVENVISL
jgi:hypothetical protein